MTPARQLLEQRLRLLQIARIKALSEPPVNRSQQFARLLRLTLVTPEAREAHGGAEFPGFGLLLTGDGEGALEVRFCFGGVGLRRQQSDFAGNAIDLGQLVFGGGRKDVDGQLVGVGPQREIRTLGYLLK